MVSNIVTFKLTETLEELTAYFDQTETQYNAPIRFDAFGATSLTTL